MVILRCTQKLLARLHVNPTKNVVASTNVLGAWYANVFLMDRRPFVICMNERSFLSVILPLKEAATLQQRICSAAGDLFLRLGIPQNAVDQELAEMSSMVFGRTDSRALLGNLKELLDSAKYIMQMNPHQDLADLGLTLSDYLIGPGPYRVPRKLARQLLGGAA
jgi:hypothetical protein